LASLSETKKQKSFHDVDQQEGRHLEMQLQAIEDRRQRTIDLLQKMRLDQPDFDFDELDQVSTSIKLFPLFRRKNGATSLVKKTFCRQANLSTN
jgi:demethoxyubiquinone hydroxylase (CLK1/Coq7/Cat5 family)